VVWTLQYDDSGMYATRVSSSGQVLDSQQIDIAVPDGLARSNAVAAGDDSGFWVVWEQENSQNETSLYGTAVSTGGVVAAVGGGKLFNTNAGGTDTLPSIVFNGTEFLITWQQVAADTSVLEVWAARLLPDGSVLDPGGFEVTHVSGSNYSEHAMMPSVGIDGDAFVIVWDHRVCCSASDSESLQATFINDDGSVGVTTTVDSSFSGTTPRVAESGPGAYVTWKSTMSGVGLVGRTIDTTGNPGPLQALSPKVVYDESLPNWAITGNPSGALVVWSEAIPQSGVSMMEAYDNRIAPDGAARGYEAISWVANDQERLSAVRVGRNYFVVWTDLRRVIAPMSTYDPVPHNGSPDTEIYGARVAATGSFIKGSMVRISRQPGQQADPQVAWDGRHLLVAWQNRSLEGGATVRIDGKRLDASGRIIDRQPIHLTSKNDLGFGLAASNNRFFVAWGLAIEPGHPIVDRVSVLDDVVSPRIAVHHLRQNGAPMCAWSGRGLVVASADRESESSHGHIEIGRTDTRGRPLGKVARIHSPRGSLASLPEVEATGNGSLVAWISASLSTFRTMVAHVSPSGAVEDSTGLPVSSDYTSPLVGLPVPSILATPRGYIVTWTEGASNSDLAEQGGPGQQSDIYGSVVARRGRAKTPPQSLVASPYIEWNSVLARAGSDATTLFYDRRADGQKYGGVARIFLRRIEFRS
jgi:hypothetical protein